MLHCDNRWRRAHRSSVRPAAKTPGCGNRSTFSFPTMHRRAACSKNLCLRATKQARSMLADRSWTRNRMFIPYRDRPGRVFSRVSSIFSKPSKRFPSILWPMSRLAYGAADMKEKAVEILKGLDELSKERYFGSFWRAFVWTGLREKSEALGNMEKAYFARFHSPDAMLIAARLKFS